MSSPFEEASDTSIFLMRFLFWDRNFAMLPALFLSFLVIVSINSASCSAATFASEWIDMSSLLWYWKSAVVGVTVVMLLMSKSCSPNFVLRLYFRIFIGNVCFWTCVFAYSSICFGSFHFLSGGYS